MTRPVTLFTGQWVDIPIEELVEWEGVGMDRIRGVRESAAFARAVDFESSATAFDAAFGKV